MKKMNKKLLYEEALKEAKSILMSLNIGECDKEIAYILVNRIDSLIFSYIVTERNEGRIPSSYELEVNLMKWVPRSLRGYVADIAELFANTQNIELLANLKGGV